MGARRIHPEIAVYVALFAALTAVAAFVKIPTPLVPVTLQTAAVLMSGLLLGPRYGALSQIIYITMGLLGFPVFAYGGGIGYVLNPTFGYLCGFVLGAGLCGFLTGDWRRASTLRLVGALLSGLAVIYLVGLTYLHFNLMYLQGQDKPVYDLILKGFLIFLPTDLVEILCLVLIIRILKRREHLMPVLR